jgi:hypothetical protein
MVIGKCREWTGEQVETAAVLCLVYGKFIEVCISIYPYFTHLHVIGVEAKRSCCAE